MMSLHHDVAKEQHFCCRFEGRRYQRHPQNEAYVQRSLETANEFCLKFHSAGIVGLRLIVKYVPFDKYQKVLYLQEKLGLRRCRARHRERFVSSLLANHQNRDHIFFVQVGQPEKTTNFQSHHVLLAGETKRFSLTKYYDIH